LKFEKRCFETGNLWKPNNMTFVKDQEEVIHAIPDELEIQFGKRPEGKGPVLGLPCLTDPETGYKIENSFRHQLAMTNDPKFQARMDSVHQIHDELKVERCVQKLEVRRIMVENNHL